MLPWGEGASLDLALSLLPSVFFSVVQSSDEYLLHAS